MKTNMSNENEIETAEAKRIGLELHAVNLDRVPVCSTDQSEARKAVAAKVRALFRQLGVKGLSVTTPNYSMARGVDIRCPQHRGIHTPEGEIYPLRSPEAGALSNANSKKIGEILDKAFPNHDDRSDSQSDYFDNPWHITA